MSPASKRPRVALVQYPPSQTYIIDSLRRAIASHPEWSISTSPRAEHDVDLQWSDYDQIDWDLVDRPKAKGQLVNSYVIRKGLIRKNHLAHTIALYFSKNPSSPLKCAAPQTIFFNLSFADELDELLVDELYDVQQSFDDDDETTWWILKAALADKGMGIRLFSTREELEAIFEEFEPVSSDEEDEDEEEGGATTGASGYGYGTDTRVDSSQLREWVIQRYISNPLLFSPSNSTQGHKFHLRVYVVASGGLTVYVHHPFLALFAPSPYAPPRSSSDDVEPGVKIDLSAHLTNTCLQTSIFGQEAPPLSVNTLPGMKSHRILSGPNAGEILGEDRLRKIEEDVREVVGEVFKAAVGAGTSFQALPNAFEIFGLDFLVDEQLQVSLLEVNACPDFAQTGKALQSIIDQLFSSTFEKVVLPYFAKQDDEPRSDSSTVSTTAEDLKKDLRVSEDVVGLRKVLEMQISKAWP